MKDNKAFITAGHAIFTIENNKGEHFTYRVVIPDDNPLCQLDFAFVGVLTGCDNTKNYTYMGTLDLRSGVLRQTKNSKIGEDAKSFRVAQWVFGMVWRSLPFPPGYTLHHEGRCGRCGRLLTVPESIESGLGPECAKVLGITL